MMVGESPRHAGRRHDGTINRTTASRLPTSLPRAGSRTRRSRLHRRRQHHSAQHALRHPELPLSRRPAPPPRPLLAVDRQGQRKDRHPTPQSDRRRALPRVDQQRPEITQDDHQNAAGRRQSQRTDDHRSQQGEGLIASSELGWKELADPEARVVPRGGH